MSARRIRTRFRSRRRRSARRPTLFPEDRARESATPFETRKTTGGRRGRGGVRGASRKGGRGKQRGYRVSRAGDQGRRTPGPKHGLFGSGALRSQLATQRRQRSYDGRRLLRRRRMGKPRLARTVRTRPPRAPPRPGRPGPNRRVRHESDKRRKESEQRIVEKRERFVSQGCPQREDRGGHDAVRDAKRRPPATSARATARMLSRLGEICEAFGGTYYSSRWRVFSRRSASSRSGLKWKNRARGWSAATSGEVSRRLERASAGGADRGARPRSRPIPADDRSQAFLSVGLI